MQVEYLLLADSAQVVGNKLYLLGGGWEQLVINSDFPVKHRMAIGAAIQVEWMETNQKHQVELEVSVDDPRKTVFKTGGQFEVGRPPGIPEGQTQRVQISIDAE